MKVTVIGVWGAYPEKDGATAGYLVQTDEVNILLDCGSAVLSKVQNFIKLEDLDAVVLSHYHGDHMCDLQSLQYATMALKKLGKRTKPLEIYGLNIQPHFDKLTYGEFTKGHEINNKSQIQIGDLSLSFSSNIHSAPCLAMRIEHNGKTLVFSGDTEWTDSLIDLSKNVDLLICESTLYNENKGKVPGHLTAGEVGEIAERAAVKKLMLSHFPHSGNLNDLKIQAEENFKGEISLAEYGKTLEI